jgi:hypothetical protein
MYADTGVLSLAPLKHLALSARVVPCEPRLQPPCAEPLPEQAEEEPTVVTAVKEPSALPPPAAATTVEEGQTAVETAAPQAALELPSGAGKGGADDVVVLDEYSAPLPPVTEPPKLTPYCRINHYFWSLRNNTELTCRLCRVKPGKSLVTKDRQPYIKTHTKASPEINKSHFITSIPIKGYLITNRVFCIKVNCSEFINTAEIKLNEKR